MGMSPYPTLLLHQASGHPVTSFLWVFSLRYRCWFKIKAGKPRSRSVPDEHQGNL